jgi:hypothetical protein
MARERFPKLNDLSLPPRGGDPEIQSLSFQSSRISGSIAPPGEVLRDLVVKVCEDYPVSTLPKWLLESRLPTVDEVKCYFAKVSPTASPGIPWAEFSKSKSELLDKYGDMIAKMVILRIGLLTKVRITSEDPIRLVKDFLMDPIRLFVKDEPHPIQKIIDGRFRLISSCSIVDEIIFGMVCGNQNQQEILFNRVIPSKCGMGLTTDDQISDLWNYVKPWIHAATSSDVSGWDWCLDEWKMNLGVETQITLTGGVNNPFYCLLLRNMVHCMCRSVFTTTCGRMFVLKHVGIMKSGFPITASWNSRIRCCLSYLIGSSNCMTMGDDCNEDTILSHDEIVARYKQIGVRVTDVVPPNGRSVSFCSHSISKDGAIPENPWKPYFNLLCNEYNNPNYLDSFKIAVGKHPLYDYLMKVYHEVNSS